MKQLDLSLYIITDENLIKPEKLTEAVEQAISGGATVLQYRAKNKNSRQMYEEALAIKKVCKKYSIPLIINDRVDIAIAVNADGVHIGQEDLDPEVVRRLIGFDKILGLSTKNVEQVKKANSLPVDYIGFGSVFPTKTKEDAKVSGIETLKEVVKLSIQPVVAIGGINRKNAAQVLKAGCKNIAVVSAVFGSQDIYKATKELKRIIHTER